MRKLTSGTRLHSHNQGKGTAGSRRLALPSFLNRKLSASFLSASVSKVSLFVLLSGTG